MKFKLDPKFEKAWEFTNKTLYDVPDIDHLMFVLTKPSIVGNWSQEELDFMVDAWYVINTGSCNPENHDAAGELTAQEELAVPDGFEYYNNEE